MITLLDIGNTHTQWRRREPGGTPGAVCSVPTDRLNLAALGGELAAACVVPARRAELERRGALLVGPEHSGGVDLSLVDASTLGADRIANAAALLAEYPLPALAVDFGTAITLEAVDAAGRFAGGAILPGRALLRRSLASGTAQLPEAAWCGRMPDAPGFDTAAAIQLGVDRGAVGAVREVLAVMLRATGARSLTAAGGDRGWFLPLMPELTDGGDDFTLRGVFYCWEKR